MPHPSPHTSSRTGLDAAAVRSLAHPLRARVLTELRQRGRATATELAAVLDTHTGATSYHLRKLEASGLVQDSGTGDGKRRVWEPTAQRTDVLDPELAEDADAATALDWLERDWLRHLTEKFTRWLELSRVWPAAWRDAATMHDTMVVVTPEQLSRMHAEIDEVVGRYRRVGQGNPEAKRVAAYQLYYPVDMENIPRGTAEARPQPRTQTSATTGPQAGAPTGPQAGTKADTRADTRAALRRRPS